ncbi:hypothetical protein CI109_104526 [Kwoniella shandongensis]|uniref:Uncharacterized protein n=1 Tax=Kwoniella shandongensis TaxID=1734106 RepID=A0A5M6BTL1_9TREE|nr:uncharacterized protein CI109_005582 [Kwoniella shandongensis]KAA5526147.1 hypothetical protein CI109_005582 [Kwoniella shandongensis]
MSLKTVQIDVTSDVICPFCPLGVKQLTTAIDKYKSTHPSAPEFNIRFLPYQLDPTLDEKPIQRKDHLARKFGAERVEPMEKAMIERFKTIGWTTDFSGPMSSSHLAHRLLSWASRRVPQNQFALSMDLFEGFHSNKHHTSDKQWLASLGVKHKMFANEQQALDWLHSDECDLEVRNAYKSAQQAGITGVPFFVFQDKYAASGAAGTEEFVSLLEEIIRRETAAAAKVAESQPESVTVEGAVC